VIENDGSTYGSVYLVRTDHIGRPVFSTGLSGAVVWRSEYLPFGGITFVSGTAEPKQVFRSRARVGCFRRPTRVRQFPKPYHRKARSVIRTHGGLGAACATHRAQNALSPNTASIW